MRSEKVKEISEKWLRIVGLCLCAVMAACSSDDSNSSSSVTTHTYKVAVLMHASESERWQRTAQWALENIAEERILCPRKVREIDMADTPVHLIRFPRKIALLLQRIHGPGHHSLIEEQAGRQLVLHRSLMVVEPEQQHIL
jgi:hypothetical protein